MANAKDRGLMRLATRSAINLNAAAGSEMSLYQVPLGKSAAITHCFCRNFSATAISAVASFGLYSPPAGNCNQFISDVVFSDIDAVDKCGIVQKAMSDLAGLPRIKAQDVFTAAQEFGIIVETAQGAACTCTVDTFGYEWEV